MLKPSVQLHEQDGILIAEFWDCWRLDPAPIQELRARYDAHLRKKGRPEVVIDLSGVGFAGSAALGNFVTLHRDARKNGGRLVFCNVEPTVVEVFRASKLEPLFDFVEGRQAALDLIAKGPSAEKSAAEPGPTPSARPPLGSRPPSSPLRRRRPEAESQ
ncbi:Putative anti-sigma factor antagonist BtrV [Aquisphaera giovannonii]|uniref:Anti-sigma factor antagonist BtrV n=1 Tax=Aquisphaera giovannonii TaxID=406548 RepID=A0A5B9W290_9BACT|nr:STAS domain-containing protein [Aquisphaera giovannonii]QEH34317.1 Putative anti-sigma factor antagonist BtrV [Aquisphaera giovannonii]